MLTSAASAQSAGTQPTARASGKGGALQHATGSALAIVDAVACAVFFYMAVLAALRGIEIARDYGIVAEVWIAALFCAVMALSGAAAFLASLGLMAAPPLAARRMAPLACACAAAAHVALSVAVLADPDPLTWLLIVVTGPATLLLAGSWAVLRRPRAPPQVRSRPRGPARS